MKPGLLLVAILGCLSGAASMAYGVGDLLTVLGSCVDHGLHGDLAALSGHCATGIQAATVKLAAGYGVFSPGLNRLKVAVFQRPRPG